MTALIEVRATAKHFRALRHVPSNEGFDEYGHGHWPDDAFTHRLVGEGSLKIVTADETATAKPSTSSKGA